MTGTAISDLLLKIRGCPARHAARRQAKQPIDAQRVADLQFDLEVAIMRKDGARRRPATRCSPLRRRIARAHRAAIRLPSLPELFARGNDPLRMLRELAELGRARGHGRHRRRCLN